MTKNTADYSIAFHNEKGTLDGCFDKVKSSEVNKTLNYLPPKWMAIVYSIKDNLPIFSKTNK
jgi:hypothetical protein